MIRVIGLLAFSVVLGLLAIDNRSIWTDEIGTWELTQWPTWGSWAQAFWGHYNSDGQLPLYHLYMHIWVMLVGDTEVALRASNVPWIFIALLGLSRIRLAELPQLWVLASAALSAFVWYYINDARPYIMYMAGASWLTAGMASIVLSQARTDLLDRGVRECLVGAVLLIGGNILGVFWIGSCLLTLLLFYPALAKGVVQSLIRQKSWSFAGIGICLVVFGVAVHSHLAGARASQTAEFSIGGIAYGLIELLGAAGLGPSRNELRIDVRAADKLQMALMFGLALLSATALLRAWLSVPIWRQRLAIACAAVLPLVLMIAIGVLLHWRVVGRHLSAMLPVVLLGLGAFLHMSVRGRWGAVWRVVGISLGVGLLASALSMRWEPRHHKDDYRQAAVWARDALGKGQTVLWIADLRAFGYYGLQRGHGLLDSAPFPGIIPFPQYPATASSRPYPDVVIYSPREGVDPTRLARPVLESGRYSLAASASSFELYVLKPATHP